MHLHLHPVPYTLHPEHCTLNTAPCTLHLAHFTLHLAPCTCTSISIYFPRVSIKRWIYQQIVASSAPFHPVLPAPVFVASILVPASSLSQVHLLLHFHLHHLHHLHLHLHLPQHHDTLNEPLAEGVVRSVFSPLHFSLSSEGAVSSSGYAAQLCILYYILLYEDTRLSAPRGSRGAQATR